jgi:hypothetical protein
MTPPEIGSIAGAVFFAGMAFNTLIGPIVKRVRSSITGEPMNGNKPGSYRFPIVPTAYLPQPLCSEHSGVVEFRVNMEKHMVTIDTNITAVKEELIGMRIPLDRIQVWIESQNSQNHKGSNGTR